jgi:hypothetical protein
MIDYIVITLLALLSIISLLSVGIISYLILKMRIDQQRSMTLLASMIDKDGASTAIGLHATEINMKARSNGRHREDEKMPTNTNELYDAAILRGSISPDDPNFDIDTLYEDSRDGTDV